MVVLLNKMQFALRKHRRYVIASLAMVTAILFAVSAMINITWKDAGSVINGLIVFFLSLGLGSAMVYACVMGNERAIAVIGSIVLGLFLFDSLRNFVCFNFTGSLIAFNVFRILEMLCLVFALVMALLGLLMPRMQRFALVVLIAMMGFVCIDFISFITLIIIAGVQGVGGWILLAFQFLLIALDLFVGYVVFLGKPIEVAAKPMPEPVPEVKPESKEEAKPQPVEEPKPEEPAPEEK